MYRETGINPFNIPQKIVCAALGISLFPYIAFTEPSNFFIMIAIDLALIGLLLLLNLKYKKPGLIAKATVTHVIYGVAFSARFFFWIILLAGRLAGVLNSTPGKLFGYDPSADAARYKREAAALAEAEAQSRREAEEAEEL